MSKLISKILRFMGRIVKAILPCRTYEKLRNCYFRVFVYQSKRAKAPKATELQHGINLFMYCLNSSAGIEGHLLELALEAAQIPYNVIDLSAPAKYSFDVSERPIYKTNLVICHAASNTVATMRLFGIDFRQYFNICYWAWELAEVPDVYSKDLEIFQEFWTLSGFCTNALEKKATVPVLTVPLYANPDQSVIKNGRAYFKLKKDVFLFMLGYDCNSFVSRKNPQAAVEAYLKAFSPKDSHVGLMIKLTYPENYKKHIEELQESLKPYPNIYFIEKYLSDEEMRTLIHAADTYVTLHRSEGFGLIPLEAMAMGTSVISTAWSGNMEYMTSMNTALVSYRMVPVAGQYIGSTPGDGMTWADPDVDEAAEYMRRMVKDEQWREKLIQNGKYTANECYNVSAISKIIRSRLKFLNLL